MYNHEHLRCLGSLLYKILVERKIIIFFHLQVLYYKHFTNNKLRKMLDYKLNRPTHKVAENVIFE